LSARGVEAALLRLFWGQEGKNGREERQRGERGKRERGERERREREKERESEREQEQERAREKERDVETEKIRGTDKAQGRTEENNSRHSIGRGGQLQQGCERSYVTTCMSLLASCVHTKSHAREKKRERRSPEKRTGMVQQACSSLMRSRVAPLTHFLHHK
jgi:hypothetical protein